MRIQTTYKEERRGVLEMMSFHGDVFLLFLTVSSPTSKGVRITCFYCSFNFLALWIVLKPADLILEFRILPPLFCQLLLQSLLTKSPSISSSPATTLLGARPTSRPPGTQLQAASTCSQCSQFQSHFYPHPLLLQPSHACPTNLCSTIDGLSCTSSALTH